MHVEYNVTDEAVEIMLHGVIGDDFTGTDSQTVARVLSQNRGKSVELRVNSPGGLAYDGVAMFNAIKSHDGATTGIIEGMAGSAASLAVIACDRVLCYQGAVFQPHYSMIMTVGHQADIRDALEKMIKLDGDLEQLYSEQSGQSVAVVKAQLMGSHGDGTRFTAAEALAAGYVDEVISHGKKKQAAAKLDAALPGMSDAVRRHNLARFEMGLTKRIR
jgi:ATP-dependent protease ClpP protease subunit|tara:strand:+ start:427 stop:1077 length:651 start_codon:yes stop_codon:yes gene_type:complete